MTKVKLQSAVSALLVRRRICKNWLHPGRKETPPLLSDYGLDTEQKRLSAEIDFELLRL